MSLFNYNIFNNRVFNTESSGWLGGGGEGFGYATPHQKLLADKEKLKKLEVKIAEVEAIVAEPVPEGLSKKETKKLEKSALKLQEEIRLLLLQRAALIRLITDEEECLLILYSLPFIH